MELTEEQKVLIEKLIDSFNMIKEQLMEFFNSFFEYIKSLFKYSKIKKYSNIYNRTKSRRIRKKQTKRIEKILLEDIL